MSNGFAGIASLLNFSTPLGAAFLGPARQPLRTARRLTNLRDWPNKFLLAKCGNGFSTGLCYFLAGNSMFFQAGKSQCLADDLRRGRFSGADLTDFWSSERVLERDGERATLANIIHQSRPETR